jgi:hypothetical protein
MHGCTGHKGASKCYGTGKRGTVAGKGHSRLHWRVEKTVAHDNELQIGFNAIVALLFFNSAKLPLCQAWRAIGNV